MSPTKPHVLEISIPSTYEAMERVAGLIEEIGRKAGISEDDEVDLMISVMEAVNNAIQHGNREDPLKKVFVRVTADGREFRCLVRDEGEGFNPARVPDPLCRDNLLKPSGRGILMMREFMDAVTFSAEPDGTAVRMTKRLHPNENGHAS